MGIAISTLEGLFAPLQRLVYWLAGHPATASGSTAQAPSPVQRPPAVRRAPAVRPVRVVRVIEPSRTPAGAGRLVISGRLADVCAELDRLCALEAAR